MGLSAFNFYTDDKFQGCRQKVPVFHILSSAHLLVHSKKLSLLKKVKFNSISSRLITRL